MRLIPVVAGGGLYGRGDYDDGVYFAAASGLVHGLLPYRDFLLLHPPGILLALAPFAALANGIGDPTAFAVARIGFMLLGAANAILVALVLRRLGLVAAFTGGLCYAVFLPAVRAEHSTLLEPIATTCLLVALILVLRAAEPAAVAHRFRRNTTWLLVAVGGLLGVATTFKIWGVVPLAAVALWVLLTAGWRRMVPLLIGFAVAATAICLPFFIAAPQRMWKMVVLAQLGRSDAGVGWLDRAEVIAGLPPASVFANSDLHRWLLLVSGITFLGCCAGAATIRIGRLSLLLVAATAGLLLITPSWFHHYAAFSAAPIALVIGSGASWLAGRLHRPTAVFAAIAAVGALIAGYAGTVVSVPYGRPFPTSAFAAQVASTAGCVTADDPIGLIELDVNSRNLERGCRLVADLGGYNYVLQSGSGSFRRRIENPDWQQTALSYLRGGNVAIVGTRFRRGVSFTSATARQVHSWPVLQEVGAISIRRPLPQFNLR